MIDKKVTEFYALNNTNKYQSYCKECTKINARESKKKLKQTEKYKQARKLYIHKNKEKINKYNRERRARIKETKMLLNQICDKCGMALAPKWFGNIGILK